MSEIELYEIKTFGDKDEPSYIVNQITGQKISLLLRSHNCPKFIFIKEYKATLNVNQIVHCQPYRKQRDCEKREMTLEESKINNLFLENNNGRINPPRE